MKPATPLPWRLLRTAHTVEISGPEPMKLGERPCVVGWSGFDSCDLSKPDQVENAQYIIHAANAYPRLVHRAHCRIAFLTGMFDTLPVRLRPHYEATLRAEIENDMDLLRELVEAV